jgi:ATP-dependent DNA helicase 2 subunit 1
LQNYIAQKDAVLFAIDVSETMLAPPPPSDDKKAEKDSPTTAAIKCAYQIMQQRIISSPKDMMGVLLFGTEESKFQDEDGNDRGNVYPHCYLLSDLNVPSAEDVKVLKAIVEEEEEAKSYCSVPIKYLPQEHQTLDQGACLSSPTRTILMQVTRV